MPYVAAEELGERACAVGVVFRLSLNLISSCFFLLPSIYWGEVDGALFDTCLGVANA